MATVSRVFNGSDAVREKTRRRVREAAKALRYVPNEAARGLIRSKTETIGVVLPGLHGGFFSEVLRGIEDAARQAGFHVLVSGSRKGRQEIETMLRAMHGRVDGVLIMSPLARASELKAHLPEGLPVVFMNSAAEGLAYDAIGIENYGGAYAAVEHLVAHGHRRIAIITGPEGNRDAAERLRGYRDALRDGGAERDAALEVEGDFLEPTGYYAARRVLEIAPRPTALFAANDAMAIGALGALRDAEVRVPDDMAVAGFDDIPVAKYISPALTSVHVPIHALGARATDWLLEAIQAEEQPDKPRQETAAAALVVRRSCGCSREGRPPPPRA